MTRAPFPGSPLTGSNLMTGLNSRFKELYDAAAFPLTSIGGTANAVTATLVPALDGDGLIVGMGFSIDWDDTNTAGVTLAINGGSSEPVLNADGSALAAGAIGPGLRSLLSWDGSAFRIMSPTLLMGGASGVRFHWTFTASGTWTKPTDLPDDTPVLLRAWGGGGGGGSGATEAGGGGGSYIERWVRAGDLGPTVSVTVGLGGGLGLSGGNSSFGGFAVGYGGAGAAGNTGGGGGGTNEAASGSSGGYQGGGNGGASQTDGSNAGLYGGGGGAGGGAGAGGWDGGRAVYGGGGGGGGLTGSNAGVSLFAGNGGNAGSAGQAPAGGGGRQGTGARGEVRVSI